MSIMPPLLSNAAAGSADWSAFRLTLDQYHAMVDAGILTKGDRVELIDGLLVEKMSINRPHVLWTRRVHKALETAVENGNSYVGAEQISFGTSEPEPDVVVVRGHPNDYPDEPPTIRDVLLAVEVADSSLARDRGWKKELYARSGLPICWIMNVNAGELEVYERPVGGIFTASRTYKQNEAISIVIDGVELGTFTLSQLAER